MKCQVIFREPEQSYCYTVENDYVSHFSDGDE